MQTWNAGYEPAAVVNSSEIRTVLSILSSYVEGLKSLALVTGFTGNPHLPLTTGISEAVV
jgi:hypothetical protein